jgi:hypothetical protein
MITDMATRIEAANFLLSVLLPRDREEKFSAAALWQGFTSEMANKVAYRALRHGDYEYIKDFDGTLLSGRSLTFEDWESRPSFQPLY